MNRTVMRVLGIVAIAVGLFMVAFPPLLLTHITTTAVIVGLSPDSSRPGSVPTSVYLFHQGNDTAVSEADEQRAINIAKDDPRVQELLDKGAAITNVEWAVIVEKEEASEFLVIVGMQSGDKLWQILVSLDEQKVLFAGGTSTPLSSRVPTNMLAIIISIAIGLLLTACGVILLRRAWK